MPERVTCAYRNLSKRFYNTNNDYTKQYCAIYAVRLETMRKLLEDRVAKKWGDQYPIVRLSHLSAEDYPKCVVIGTLYKDQKLKPSVLKQLHAENQLLPQPVHKHFTDETDAMYVEDETQRFKLIGNVDVKHLTTGITCALLGLDLGNGKFDVDEIVFADLRLQIERPLLDDNVYVVLLSGLDLMHYEHSLVQLQLFAQWIFGAIPSPNHIDPRRVARVIIAGNSIKAGRNSMEKQAVSMTTNIVESEETIEAVKTLDTFLHQLCHVVDVDIMPGANDPSNHILPQKNMHVCMFPQSSAYKSMNSVTNPYDFEFGGCRILGTSGQCVTDLMRFADFEQPIDALEACLRWSHVAPTAPDTLSCFPYYDNDPFIIDECPHVLFTANHGEFDTKLVHGSDGQVVRLIVVPEFATTQCVCVVNLKDLNCIPLDFVI